MIKRITVAAACMLLAACGGGNSDKSEASRHLVDTSVDEGVTLRLAQSQVADGHFTSALLVVDPHYELTSIKGCGGKLSGDIYYTGVILANCTITASAQPKSYSLSVATAVGGTGMTTTPTVVYNQVGRVTLTADSGYHIKAATSNCGGSLAVNIFTTDKLKGDCVVQPVFEVDSTSVEAQTYVVTVLSAVGGTPSPATQSVAENDYAKVDFIADTRYSLVSVTSSCGGTLVGQRFTTGKVTANCTLQPNYQTTDGAIIPALDPSEIATIGGSVAEGATLAAGGTAAQTGAVKNKLVTANCKDGKGFIGNPVTDANGFYTGQLRKSSLPCALQVITNTNVYYSQVYGDVSVVNITPLTSLAIAYGSASSPILYYNLMNYTTDVSDLGDAQVALAAKLQERGYGMPDGSFLPFNTPFVPGDSWDKLIDQLAISIKNANLTFSDVEYSFTNGNLDGLPAASQ
jgi:hypothetical protein